MREELPAELLPEVRTDPMQLLARWIEEAKEAGEGVEVPMVLATSGDHGPDARVVLLKGIQSRSLRFFTNLESTKGQQLRTDPRVCAVFHLRTLARQVRAYGNVALLPEAEVEAYFRTRPRGSRIGAWASKQSVPIASRVELDAAFAQFDALYPSEDVPVPPFWGGYSIDVQRLEFWMGRSDRLHDRFAVTLTDNRCVRVCP